MHSLKPDEQKIPRLHRNGHPLRCPFVPPFPVPNSIGGVSLSMIQCGNDCPHFRLYQEDNIVRLTCGTIESEIQIDKLNTNHEKKSSLIISPD